MAPVHGLSVTGGRCESGRCESVKEGRRAVGTAPGPRFMGHPVFGYYMRRSNEQHDCLEVGMEKIDDARIGNKDENPGTSRSSASERVAADRVSV